MKSKKKKLFSVYKSWDSLCLMILLLICRNKQKFSISKRKNLFMLNSYFDDKFEQIIKKYSLEFNKLIKKKTLKCYFNVF